ncbi:hypothetical protein C3747_246g27 [Trypanosoma cruzi]|uniref:Uncharacterized protein n=2 Tax=Trypanosoma cruzi TaxID=5693 RepID=Q4D8P7_TRYCC|nr:hypothetical protein, conserved [Trypanosoma cruzi]EAN88898.1 hypothetical protein, conserved [Trypanosoma cruzi]KAF5218179.1 hypothetical protein ECC02_008891 [Trypanosoma cruzi]KAF8295877.1 hypothetical protein TcYC6_0092070 [Trypanosoma cruzi]PWU97185.1 hypothetical protein C3747_246g27 [Trypanosoma cruzi]RNC57183.1 hypothetical protein TcCL_ESM05254 [Trypanosoma cruzi]|eukprot:XP_810749.1 hypothetical protein [Trypanosoma cruzi strain CL Brener]
MSWREKGRPFLRSPFLLDTREFITDKCILRQLTHFAHVHRLGSPLWLGWELAAGLGLTLRYMQSPLNIWSPLMGESFFPLNKASTFSDAVMQKYPLRQFLHFSKISSAEHLTTKQNLVLSAAASSDGNPRWYRVPEAIEHFFELPSESSSLYCHPIQQVNEVGLFVLWISAVLFSRMMIAPEAKLLVQTPSSYMSVVNADQLYPSSFLAEKELECLVLQS